MAATPGWGLGSEGLSLPRGKMPIALEGAWRNWGLCPPPHTAEAWGEFSQPLGVEAAGLGELQPLQVLLEDLPSLLQRAERMCCCGASRSPQGLEAKGGQSLHSPRGPGTGLGRAALRPKGRERMPGPRQDASGTMGTEPEMAGPGRGFSGPRPPPASPALPGLSSQALLPRESKGESLLRWPTPFSPKAVAFGEFGAFSPSPR